MYMTLPLEFKRGNSDAIETRHCDPASGLCYVTPHELPLPPFDSNKVISLFSGSGGMDIGLEAAGFETVACVEIDKDCRATLTHNRPDWKLIDGGNPNLPGDVRTVTGDEILRSVHLRRGEPALVVGGPPCQPFSNIGKKRGVEDPINGDLYAEYVRIVKECLPKAFIFENVEGLRQGKHSQILDYLVGELSGAGYSVTYTVVNAADYGVPQQRKRFIMLGLRGDKKPCFPTPTHFPTLEAQVAFQTRIGVSPEMRFPPWNTVGDAFGNLSPSLKERPDYAVMNISAVVQHRMTFLKQGENFKALPMELRPNCWKNGRHQGQDTFGRLRDDRPSVTIRTAAYNPAKGMYIHPTENRGLNSHEMAALQSFPPDWEFKCAKRSKVTLVSVGKQIGNAVPPRLAEALGLAIRVSLMD